MSLQIWGKSHETLDERKRTDWASLSQRKWNELNPVSRLPHSLAVTRSCTSVRSSLKSCWGGWTPDVPACPALSSFYWEVSPSSLTNRSSLCSSCVSPGEAEATPSSRDGQVAQSKRMRTSHPTATVTGLVGMGPDGDGLTQ